MHCLLACVGHVVGGIDHLVSHPFKSAAAAHPSVPQASPCCACAEARLVAPWSASTKKKTLEPAEIATISVSTAVRTDGVDEKPSGGKNKCRTVHVDTSMKVSFLDMRCEVRDTLKWSLQNRLSEVRRLCPGVFDELEASTPHREKRSAATTVKLGRPRLLSAAEMAKLLGTSCMSCV